MLNALNNPGRIQGKLLLFGRETRKGKMSSLRKTISRRLVEAKNTTAMLTTFNEVDMTKIMAIRTQFKDKFKETKGVRIGLYELFRKSMLFCFAGMAIG